MNSKIEVGKQYMLIHGDGEGPDWCRSPSVHAIDLSQPVTVLSADEQNHYGETIWEIWYIDTDRNKKIGYACDRSFGVEVK